MARYIADCEMPTGKATAQIKKICGDSTMLAGIVMAQYMQAMKGNTKAFNALVAILGEDKVKQDSTGNIVFNILPASEKKEGEDDE